MKSLPRARPTRPLVLVVAEARVERVSVPLSYADELYALRTHIQLVGNRLRAAADAPRAAT